MTPHQRDVLQFIKTYWEENKYSPSYRDIAGAIKGGLSHAHHTVNILKSRGFLFVDRGKGRAIYPIEVWHRLRGEKGGEIKKEE
jgi:SOS-response transcriptional repressor LexA